MDGSKRSKNRDVYVVHAPQVLVQPLFFEAHSNFNDRPFRRALSKDAGGPPLCNELILVWGGVSLRAKDVAAVIPLVYMLLPVHADGRFFSLRLVFGNPGFKELDDGHCSFL